MGAGWVIDEWIERTPEYQAKLDAKREAKRAAERAAQEAEEAKREAERKAAEEKAEADRMAEEARIKAQKAISQYVGEIGAKITVKGTFDHTAWYDTHDPFGRVVTKYIHSFKDSEGNVLVWRTTNGLGGLELNKGEPVILTGTVKEHSEYKDEKQTALLRCKVARPAPDKF